MREIWTIIGTGIALAVLILNGQGAVRDLERRMTALEVQRAGDAVRLERIESIIDRAHPPQMAKVTTPPTSDQPAP